MKVTDKLVHIISRNPITKVCGNTKHNISREGVVVVLQRIWWFYTKSGRQLYKDKEPGSSTKNLVVLQRA